MEIHTALIWFFGVYICFPHPHVPCHYLVLEKVYYTTANSSSTRWSPRAKPQPWSHGAPPRAEATTVRNALHRYKHQLRFSCAGSVCEFRWVIIWFAEYESLWDPSRIIFGYVWVVLITTLGKTTAAVTLGFLPPMSFSQPLWRPYFLITTEWEKNPVDIYLLPAPQIFTPWCVVSILLGLFYFTRHVTASQRGASNKIVPHRSQWPKSSLCPVPFGVSLPPSIQGLGAVFLGRRHSTPPPPLGAQQLLLGGDISEGEKIKTQAKIVQDSFFSTPQRGEGEGGAGRAPEHEDPRVRRGAAAQHASLGPGIGGNNPICGNYFCFNFFK